MTRIEKLLKDASKLPVDQRLTLAHQLLLSTEPAAASDIQQAWDSEIKQRIERYDQGLATSKSAHEVFTALDRRLEK